MKKMNSLKKTLAIFLLLAMFVGNNYSLIAYAAETSAVATPPAPTPTITTIDGQVIKIPQNVSPIPVDTTKPTLNTQSDNGLSNGSASQRTRPVPHELFKKIYKASENLVVSVSQDTPDITTKVVDSSGHETPVDVEKIDNGPDATLKIFPPAQFKPGKYTLQISDSQGVLSTQDFTWGVLAINTNKSIYTPGEKALLSIAVLDEKGDMVCDADVKLDIKDPSNNIKTLSTTDKSIIVNPICHKKELSLIPDYEANYITKTAGTYAMTLTSVTKNGTYTITDKFIVKDSVPLDVERITATRIYPPVKYPVTFNIVANQDFEGTVTDVVPESFNISQAENVKKYDLVTKTSSLDARETRASTANLTLGLPFAGEFPISQGFGEAETDPIMKPKYDQFGLKGHDGMDFAIPSGTSIDSVDDGTVVRAQVKGDYGTTVIIQHSWGKSYYGHLSEIKAGEGKKISKGEVLGISGSTGLSTGPHLHFGMKLDDNDPKNGYVGKTDPLPYLPVEQGVLGTSTKSLSKSSVKVITWNVSIKKGEKLVLGYNFVAPNVSPQFYTLGPLRMADANKKVVFEESRLWQIAGDLDTANGDGMMIIGERNSAYATTRTYNNGSDTFGPKTLTNISGNGATVMMRTSPTKQESIAGYVDTSGVLRVICYNGNTWSSEWSVTVGGTATTRRFDISYETNSGDAIVLYSTNTATTNELAYRTKQGSSACGSGSWASATNLDPVRTSGVVQWVKMAWDRNSGSNLITAIWADANSDLSAMQWSGTAWGNEPSAALETNLEVATAAQDVDSFDVEYESTSADVMVAWSISGNNTTGLINWAACTGGTSTCTWSTPTSIATINSAGTNLDISANPNSDEIVLGAMDNGTAKRLSGAYWSGSAWTGSNLDTTTATPVAGTKLVSTGWLIAGGTTRSIIVYNDSAATNIGWYVGNGSTFTLQTDATPNPAFANPQKWYDLQMDPNNKDRLMFMVEDNNTDTWAKRLVMTSTPAFTWTDSDGSAILVYDIAQTISSPYSFAYWRFVGNSTYTQNDYRWYNNSNPSQATITHVQSTITAQTASNPSVSATFASTPVVGNTIIVSCIAYRLTAGLSTGSLTDNKGNIYTNINTVYNNSLMQGLYYAKITATGASFQVTCTPNLDTVTTIAIHEYSGIDPIDPLDKNTTSIGTSTTPDSGNITTTIANELYFGSMTQEGPNIAITPGATYTQRQEAEDGTTVNPINTEDKVVAAGTYSANWTLASSQAWSSAIATFKPAQTSTLGVRLADENTVITVPNTSTPARLRINTTVGNVPLPAGQTAFKLQFATDLAGAWTDVGPAATWRFKDNAGGYDGEPLDSTILTSSNIKGTYQEANPTFNTPAAATVGQNIEWDFALDPTAASTDLSYYFRMIRSDGTVFATYTRYPRISVLSGSPPALSKLMRHGATFDGGIEQPFVF